MWLIGLAESTSERSGIGAAGFVSCPLQNEYFFVSRFKNLRRVFGAARVIGLVDQVEQRYG